MPQLVSDLTVLPVWERNQQRSDDIIWEQMSDTEKSGEASQTRLDELMEAMDREHRAVARAMIHRLFAVDEVSTRSKTRTGLPSSSGQPGRPWQHIQVISDPRRGQRLDGIQHCKARVRVFDDRMRSAMSCDHKIRKHAKCILSLWGMFHKDFTTKHSAPGLVVFGICSRDAKGQLHVRGRAADNHAHRFPVASWCRCWHLTTLSDC